MATRRRKVSDSEAQHGVDKLRKRKELFIQQFEKEAQERIDEMEAKLDKLLVTMDRTFKIEMMKLPPSFHTTLMKDILKAQEDSVGEVTMAIVAASPEISRPLSRKPSERGKATNSGAQQRSGAQTKTEDGSKRRARKTMKTSNSAGNLRCASSVSTTRSTSRVTKLRDQALVSGLKPRFISRSLSEDLSSRATALITTSLGKTLLLTEETKDEIQLDQLDDLALCQMQKIKELMEYLSKKKLNSSQ